MRTLVLDAGGVGPGLVQVGLGAHDIDPRLEAGVEKGLRLPLERLALAQRFAADALEVHGAQDIEIGNLRGEDDFHA